VIGHRGAAACAPENTLAGLRRAGELGCTWVEVDVRLSSDGAPVLCHDPTLDRTTDGSGRIAALPLAAIRRCDAGIRFGAVFAGEKVPRLDEALELAAAAGLGVNIELKAERGREYATAAAVVRSLPPFAGRMPGLLLSSFDLAILSALRTLAPQVPRGVLFRAVPRFWRAVAVRLGCAVIGADYRRLRPRRIAEIRAAGYQCAAYTVNSRARARLLFAWGVTSVFSDAPDIITELGTPLGAAPAAPTRQGAIR
jgi:glycerophosphoryl diester phosphodiesterase